jgi:hypothetical protein
MPRLSKRYVGESRRGENANPLTSMRLYTEDELEFLKAIDLYKRQKHRPHPAWHEVLAVFKSLGYRKVEEQHGEVH